MSDSKAPDSPASASSPAASGPVTPGASAMEDPIVAKAREAMAELFSSTIAALGGDVKKLLATNAPKAGPVGQVFSVFTNDMIDLLGSRVKAAFPGTPAAGGGATQPSSQTSSSPASPSPEQASRS